MFEKIRNLPKIFLVKICIIFCLFIAFLYFTIEYMPNRAQNLVDQKASELVLQGSTQGQEMLKEAYFRCIKVCVITITSSKVKFPAPPQIVCMVNCTNDLNEWETKEFVDKYIK